MKWKSCLLAGVMSLFCVMFVGMVGVTVLMWRFLNDETDDLYCESELSVAGEDNEVARVHAGYLDVIDKSAIDGFDSQRDLAAASWACVDLSYTLSVADSKEHWVSSPLYVKDLKMTDSQGNDLVPHYTSNGNYRCRIFCEKEMQGDYVELSGTAMVRASKRRLVEHSRHALIPGEGVEAKIQGVKISCRPVPFDSTDWGDSPPTTCWKLQFSYTDAAARNRICRIDIMSQDGVNLTARRCDGMGEVEIDWENDDSGIFYDWGSYPYMMLRVVMSEPVAEHRLPFCMRFRPDKHPFYSLSAPEQKKVE